MRIGWIIRILMILSVMTLLGCQDRKPSESSDDKIALSVENTQIVPTIETKDMIEKSNIPASNPKITPIATPESDQKYTIVIDAGHQSKANSQLEPIGPGASQTKKKVSSGTQGVFTKVPEYKVNLQVSLKLRDILKNKGYTVIMIRESNNVNISNAERAKIANKKKADVFIRIHCNGSTNQKVVGTFTICPTKDNVYCSSIYKKCRKLSECVLKGLCDNTGAKNRNIMETDSMSGINWSKVPVTIVEMGYMSNASEDKKLNDHTYQDKLAHGISEGIENYLRH